MKKLLPLVLAGLAGCLGPVEDSGFQLGDGSGGTSGLGSNNGNGSGGQSNNGSGGSLATGGSSSTGGSSASGGSGSGGTVASGGASTGGTVGTGGQIGTTTGGSAGMASGGTVGSGGTSGGGALGTGSGGNGSGGGGRGGGTAVGSGGVIGQGGATAAVCTSMKMSTVSRGQDMRPGNDCTGCHNFAIAGTVYPSAHEVDNCNGTAAGGIKVVLTGSDGTVLTLTPSATSGTFYSNTKLKTPFTAKVTNSAGGSRAMATGQTVGGCNSCHTATGANNAPGRIMAP